MIWKTMSLRNRMFFLSISGIIAIAVFFLINSFAFERSRHARARKSIETETLLSTQKSASIFRQMYWEIQSIASHSVFLGSSREQVSQVLNNFVLNNENYDAVVFVDSQGHFVAANGVSMGGKPLQLKNLEGRIFADTVWFQKALRGEFTENSSQSLSGSVVEDVHIDPISSALYGSPQKNLGFSRAVYGADGVIVGVVTARASLRPFELEMTRQFQALQAQGYPSAHLYLINSSGLILAEASSQERLAKFMNGDVNDRIMRWNLSTQQGQQAAADGSAGQSGYLLEVDRLDKVERAWGFQPVKSPGFLDELKWSVIVSAETQDIVSEVLTQRVNFVVVFGFICVALGLINFGVTGTIAKHVTDTLAKVKEESRSLSELGESFESILRQAASGSAKRVAALQQAVTHFDGLTGIKDESQGLVQQSSNHMKDLVEKTAQSEQVLQRISVEVTLAQRSNEKIAGIEDAISEVMTRLEKMSEIVFKAQLISYNASIEANRAGIHGKGFLPVAQELENLVDGTESLLKEMKLQLSAGKSSAAEHVVQIRRSLSDGSFLVEEFASKMAGFRKEIEAVALGLNATSAAMEGRGPSLSSLRESMQGVESGVVQSEALMSEMARIMNSIADSAIRIEELNQSLLSSLKGVQPRSRVRRTAPPTGSPTTAQGRTNDEESDLTREHVVDRLAQKMRPRLVVEREPEEPEVSPDGKDDSTLKVG